jgi:archaetidylinositol phosphate synthase
VSHNTHIHKVARLAIKPFIGTIVRPNHVTTARLLVGIAAAGSLAVGEGPWPAIGAGLFVLSVLLDRADGELARLTNTMSSGGHQYDLIADAICNALILIGLGVGLRESVIGDWAILYGFVAGVSIAAILWIVIKIEALDGQRTAELPSFGGFDVDDLILLIPVGIWLGWSESILLAAATITPLVALIFIVMLMRGKRAA